MEAEVDSRLHRRLLVDRVVAEVVAEEDHHRSRVKCSEAVIEPAWVAVVVVPVLRVVEVGAEDPRLV